MSDNRSIPPTSSHCTDNLHVFENILCVRWAVLCVNGNKNEESVGPLINVNYLLSDLLFYFDICVVGRWL